MVTEVALESVYIHSQDVVSRDIDGELIIVPLAFNVGDMEGEIYTLNVTGRSIWMKLNGKKSLREIIETLKDEFKASPGEIEEDILGLIGELLKRRLIVEI